MAAGLPGRLAASERESATGMALVWAGIPKEAPNHAWRARDRGAGSAVCLGASGLVRGSLALNPVTQIICMDSPQPAHPERPEASSVDEPLDESVADAQGAGDLPGR